MVKRRDGGTLDLFRDYEPPEVTVGLEPEITKGGTLDVKIARAISHSMQKSGMDRIEIAQKMSDYLGGQNVTENMLNTYASPARRDHKITLERLIALVDVTGCHELLGFVAGFSDFVVVPKRYAEIIHLWIAEEEKEKMDRHLTMLRSKVKGMQ